VGLNVVRSGHGPQAREELLFVTRREQRGEEDDVGYLLGDGGERRVARVHHRKVRPAHVLADDALERRRLTMIRFEGEDERHQSPPVARRRIPTDPRRVVRAGVLLVSLLSARLASIQGGVYDRNMKSTSTALTVANHQRRVLDALMARRGQQRVAGIGEPRPTCHALARGRQTRIVPHSIVNRDEHQQNHREHGGRQDGFPNSQFHRCGPRLFIAHAVTCACVAGRSALSQSTCRRRWRLRTPRNYHTYKN
jgi:hypothetical protein